MSRLAFPKAGWLCRVNNKPNMPRREAEIRGSRPLRGTIPGGRLLAAAVLLSAVLPGTAGAADSATVAVGATVLSKSNCKFNSASTALSFGAIDPAGSADATATASLIVKCAGAAPLATFFIAHDSGLYGASPSALRMRHATLPAEYLPYGLTLDPVTASVPKNTKVTLTLSGKVTATDYQNAYAGNYADTVTLTLTP